MTTKSPMTMTRTAFAATAALLSLATFAAAQTPPAPRGKTAALIAGKRVTIEYGRVGLGGRTLDQLLGQLPPDRIWRLGINQLTTLETEDGVRLGDASLAPGKYSLYLHCPADGKFALVVNRHLGIALKTVFPGAPPELAYEPWPVFLRYTDRIGKHEVARVPLLAVDLARSIDPLEIQLTEDGSSAKLTIGWATKAFSVGLTAPPPGAQPPPASTAGRPW